MEEIHKDIKGYEDLYSITNFGRIYSKRNSIYLTLDKSVQPQTTYLRAVFQDNGRIERHLVHRLVAESFLKEPSETLVKECLKSGSDVVLINHKDGNKQNNHFSNLEWSDRSEQMYHAYDLQLKKSQIGIENKNSKLTSDDIKEIRKLYVRQSKEYGTVALAKKYGVTDSVIGLIIRNKSYKNVK